MQFDLSEVQIFSFVHDVYPLIDPNIHFTSQTFKDKVVIITGGSKGIGATTALFYAKSGAKVVITARNTKDLEERKASIEKDAPGAQVLVVAGDIADPEVGKRAVQAAVQRWDRVDIVIANSGVAQTSFERFHQRDPLTYWYMQEVNVRGTLNVIHAAIPELLKTKGQIIVLSSTLAHVREPAMSGYSISKHTINRFVEILALEYSFALTVYACHPGVIPTVGAVETMEKGGVPEGAVEMPDTVELPAATFLWLTARNAEFLSGRYVQATWNLNEVVAKKEEITSTSRNDCREM
ncbi:NAD-P-binding protein [Peniophora sp. CONT]|nr:NAD-P-binding protein [Peniophora sp. CONT]